MKPRIWAVLAALLWLGAALYGAAPAHAYPYTCRTDPGSSYTYIYCHGTDNYGNPINTVTVCYASQNHCTTRDE